MDNVDLVWDITWMILFFLREILVFENLLSMLLDIFLSEERDKWI